MNRYAIKCRRCDGSGFHRYTDDEGNLVLDDCSSCYRGTLTILLTEKDEDWLLNALREARARR